MTSELQMEAVALLIVVYLEGVLAVVVCCVVYLEGVLAVVVLLLLIGSAGQ